MLIYNKTTTPNCIIFAVITFYIITSYLIFHNVHNTVDRVIDEEFHIPQGLAYCNFNFFVWDPKITTLPGLYIVSTVILGPLRLCSTYWLRFVNFIVGVINLCLLVILFGGFNKNAKESQRLSALWSGLNLALLPPLFFFTNLYYTDVVSLMFIILLLLFNKNNKHGLASLCGLFSVIVRQTNIIWVAMLFGDYILREFYTWCIKTKRKRKLFDKISEEDLKSLRMNQLWEAVNVRNLPNQVLLNFYTYLSVIALFIMFLVVNGSIVVGDKTAHTAVIHMPQLFYFSLFCLVFAWPHFLNLLLPFIKFVYKHILYVLVLIVIIMTIVYANTLVHPYLLADNRHYTFYIWGRFYQKIPFFRYIITPAYLFGLYSIICSVYSRHDITFALMYLPCTAFVLVLQKMIEVRYFLIPFLLFRTRIQPSYKMLLMELSTYLVINFITLTIFFTKDIYWSDFDYVQKLIW